MIISIIIGKGESRLKGKNMRRLSFTSDKTGNRFVSPMLSFPIMACIDSKEVDYTYFVSDDFDLLKTAVNYNALPVHEHKEVQTTGEACFIRSWDIIRRSNTKVEFLLLMFANAPAINFVMIDDMIKRLRLYPEADSICTISCYPEMTPYRMRKLKKMCGNYIEPFIDDIDFSGITCDRNSGARPYIYDCSCCVIRPENLDNIESGQLPMRWLGNNILGYKQNFPACDVDESYQFFQVEEWLRRNWT